MYRELIHILHDARRLQELEIAYSRDDYLRPLTRILCKEEEGGILELEGEEIISVSLKKPCLADFLTKEQKKQLGLYFMPVS